MVVKAERRTLPAGSLETEINRSLVRTAGGQTQVLEDQQVEALNRGICMKIGLKPWKDEKLRIYERTF